MTLMTKLQHITEQNLEDIEKAKASGREFVAVDTGQGHSIMEGLTLFMTQRALAVVLILSMLVVVMDLCLRSMEKHFLKWRPQRIL